MGVKEDGLQKRTILGWFGKVRPLQVEGGPCIKCGHQVWIDCPPALPAPHAGQEVQHHGCKA